MSAEILEKHGWQVIQTAGVIKNPHKLTNVSGGVYTHGDQYAQVDGRFTAEELRALADYMDGKNGRG